MKPRITIENERLFQERLHLKKILTQHREENMRLRKKNSRIVKSGKSLQKIIADIEAVSGVKPMKNLPASHGSGQHLTFHLKKHLKTARKKLTICDTAIESFKRDSKHTKMKELEVIASLATTTAPS